MSGHGHQERIEQLLAEFAERREDGEALDAERFAAEHPDLGDRLPAALAALESTEALFPGPDQPTRVGPYRVLDELGRGGMGRIFRAEHEDRPGEFVALKVLHVGLDGQPRALERFRREGEALSRLRHPGIVAVHEVGLAGTRPFLAMEIVDGSSLAARLRAGSWPKADDGRRAAIRLTAFCARALAAAHEQGICHRDMNPRNILVRASDGEPVIVDFGLARSEDSPTLTATGDMLGTPSSMSPEQARGERVDARSDVWSLGSVLHELVTGQAARSGHDTLALIREAGTRPVPRARRVCPDVPADLELVLGRAMAHRPAWRYPDAASFADDLERLLRHEKPLARGPSAAERVHRLWSGHRLLMSVAGALVLACLVGYAASRVEPPGEAARRAAQAMDQAVSAWIDGDLDAMDAPLDALEATAPDHRFLSYLRNLKQGGLPDASDDPAVRALVEGERLRLAGQTEQALRQFDIAWNLAPNTPLIMLSMALGAREAGRTQDAQRAFELVAFHYGGAVEIHRSLAELYLVNELPLDAVKASDAALALAPERADLWKIAARARLATGDAAGSREAEAQATRFDG